MRKWFDVLNIFFKEIIALLVSAIIVIWSMFVFEEIPFWVYPIVGIAAFFMVLELQNIVVGLGEHITCKCFKILKLGRRTGRFSSRHKNLKGYRDYFFYMDKYMDDVFRMIWYAKKKKKSVIEAEVNEEQLKAILYCISDDAKNILQKVGRLKEGEIIITEEFEVRKKKVCLDRAVRYMYHTVPRRREILNILSAQRMYYIGINVKKVEVGEKKTGVARGIRELWENIRATEK